MATSLPTYTGDITSLVPPSGVMLVDTLLVGSKWGTSPAGTGVGLTFSFPATLDAFDTRPGVAGNYNPNEPSESGFSGKLAGFSAFSPAQQEAARQVFQAFSAVANLTFTEVAASTPDAGVLRFANAAPPGLGATTWGSSWIPQDFAGAGDTWMNSVFLFPEGWAAGTQNFLTLLHEVGHALGLKHPHDGGFAGQAGWPDKPVILPFTGTDTLTNESTQTMVMAYNDIPGRSTLNDLALQSDFAPTTPMRWDIAALQYLYGANMAYNAGNTTYTFDGAARYNQTIWDGGGIDTIVVTGTRASEIDLRAAQWSKLGQPMSFSTRNADNSLAAAQPQFNDPYTVYLYDMVTIENGTGGDGDDGVIGNDVANVLIGGLGNDTMVGLAGNDVLHGGAGNDSLDGGVGIVDIADFRGDVAVTADLLAGTAVQGSFNDKLEGFEALFASSAADTIRAADRGGILRGETVRGGGGNDTIDGGNGVDAAEFSGPRAGYTVTRNGNTVTVQDNDPSNGDDGTDTLVNVERLVFSDRMLAFGERAEELARVAFVLWTPGIVGSTTLFARGYSYYDNGGYEFNTMAGTALLFWPQQGQEFAEILVRGAPGTTRTAAELMTIMSNAGGGDAGRVAALVTMANDPATTAAIEASSIRTTGVAADLEVAGFGTLFGLLPG